MVADCHGDAAGAARESHLHRTPRPVLDRVDDEVAQHPFDPAGGDGLGLDIVRRIRTQLRGALKAENDRGARFTLTLPLPSAARPARSFAPPA